MKNRANKVVCPICDTVHELKPYTIGVSCFCGNEYRHCHGWRSDDPELVFSWLKKEVLSHLPEKNIKKLSALREKEGNNGN